MILSNIINNQLIYNFHFKQLYIVLENISPADCININGIRLILTSLF